MAELISVPLKKPTDVDIIKPLKNLIDSNYSTADKPEDYTEQISELSKLRNAAVWRAYEKYESSLEVIYSYYDQLCALEMKIPPSEVQIPFKWKDAFSVKNILFGSRVSLTISSLAYERVCVLFNIGALQSSVAASQTIDNDEGLKLAAKLFQQSAGVFNHLKGNVMAAIHQDPTPDLSPDCLSALSSIMLAQAQEIFVHKAVHDNMKDAVTAKLASQCEELYAEAMKMIQKDSVRPIWEKDWLFIVAGKQAIFHGMAEFYQSLVCKANKAVGEEIARLQKALELFKAGLQRTGKPFSMVSDLINKAQRHLTEAQKDNDFIYHERIPDSKSLSSIPRVSLVKSLPPPQRFSANFKDLFEKLVPMPVHQAMAAYEVRKSELVNTEVSKLRDATQLLNSCLASLNLPAALEDTSGQELPQSLKDKADSVCNLGGISQLNKMICELPELLQRNKDILDEADRMLNDEFQSDDQLRQQFKERWTRTPSAKLTETFRANAAKYREIINNAINADSKVKEKYEQHRRGMELLSEGPSVMAASVPSAGPVTSSGAYNSNAAGKLRALMEQVETLKAERDVIECELKCASSDMKDQFLAALSEGSINEQALSVETLGQAYGSLQKQVKESLGRQETLLNEIQTTNTEFCKEKSGAGGMAQKREAALKELAAAHDAFVELQNNLKEGNKFYNDLTQLLVAFQNKISDYCFARKTEKEELLKDLTRDLSHGPVGVLPNAPAHHTTTPASSADSSAWPTLSKFTSYLNFGSSGSSTETKKEPPPRPPPPTAAPSSTGLPYPMQPQGMPVPYNTTAPAAPYPTYALPPGYNPYHTLPAYPHQAYAQQYPQYPPQYGNYPVQYPPGQQPPQNHW